MYVPLGKSRKTSGILQKLNNCTVYTLTRDHAFYNVLQSYVKDILPTSRSLRSGSKKDGFLNEGTGDVSQLSSRLKLNILAVSCR